MILKVGYPGEPEYQALIIVWYAPDKVVDIPIHVLNFWERRPTGCPKIRFPNFSNPIEMLFK